MDTNDVIKIHEGLCEHAQALMRKKQADYIGVPVEGPYKPEHYRY